MKYLFLLVFVLGYSTADAQFGNLLKKARENLEKKAGDKIEEKMNQGIDSVVNAPEKVINKKKVNGGTRTSKQVREESPSKESNVNSETEPAHDIMSGDGTKTVIKTNILCEAGRKKIETLLREQDGVFAVKINIETGELSIRYSSDGISHSALLELINEEGFEAGGNKPSGNAPVNPCKS